MPDQRVDPVNQLRADYNVFVETNADNRLIARIMPGDHIYPLVGEKTLAGVANYMRSVGLPDGSVSVFQENPVTAIRYDSFIQLIEVDESFVIEDDCLPEISQWLLDHPECDGEIRTMISRQLVDNVEASRIWRYMQFTTSDDLARFADHWREFPTKVRFPANLRRKTEGSYRNPLLMKGYQPATMADIETARIAYDCDYPRYPQYEGDTEVSVDEFAVVDPAADGSGRWIQAWVWLHNPHHDDDVNEHAAGDERDKS